MNRRVDGQRTGETSNTLHAGGMPVQILPSPASRWKSASLLALGGAGASPERIDRRFITRNGHGVEEAHSATPQLWDFHGTEVDLAPEHQYRQDGHLWSLRCRAFEAIKAGKAIAGRPMNAAARRSAISWIGQDGSAILSPAEYKEQMAVSEQARRRMIVDLLGGGSGTGGDGSGTGRGRGSASTAAAPAAVPPSSKAANSVHKCEEDEAYLSYDELGMFDELYAELDLPQRLHPPCVSRQSFKLRDGRSMSALKWGTEPPELVQLVLLHGGKQNAHTWDAVALALNRPLIALDLPSHGHSDTALDGLHEPDTLAADIAEMMDQCAPRAKLLCGMSLGGLAAISLSALRPDLVRRLVLVDVTPGITTKTGAPSSDEVISTGVEKSFATFGAMLSSVAARNPSRPHTWLRRNVLHNTVQRAEDKVWIWRYDRYPRRHPRRCAFGALWDQLGATTAPTLLIRGMHSRMVDVSDEAELRRRLPTARVEHVPGAGHCVQSDQPIRLAALLDEFVQVPTAGAAHVQCRDLRIDLKCIEASQGV